MFSPNPADDWRRTIDAIMRNRYPHQRLTTHHFPLSDIQAAFKETLVAGGGGTYLKGIVYNDVDCKVEAAR